MNKITSVFLIAVVLLSGSQAFAEAAPARQPSGAEEAGILEPLTQWENISPFNLVSDGRYVYIDTMSYTSSSGFEMVVLDTFDPAHPIEIASLPTSADDTTLAVANNTLYMGRYSDGIFIYSVSDPSNPTLIGQFEPVETMSTRQMVISGTLAYITDMTLGLAVLDISDPAHPSLLGAFSEERIDNLVVQGQYAYARTYPGLSIYDISDPAQITRVGRYEDTTRPGYIFAVNGNYAYFNGSIDHFPDPPEYFTDVIDVSDPENPEHVNEVPELAGPIRQLSVKDGLLYAVRWDGLAIFNTTNPVSPELSGVFPSYWGSGVVALEDRALYIDFNIGFLVLDTTDPAHPNQMGFYSWPQSARYLTSTGTNVYTLDEESFAYPSYDYRSIFRLIDASNPIDARVSGYVILDGFSLGKPFVDGSFIYVPTGWGVEIIDASDPAHLKDVARTSTSFASVVEVLDGVAYSITKDLGGSGGYFNINDVTNPVSPTLLSQSIYLAPQDISIAAQGENIYAFITSNGSLIVLDVTDPANPLEMYRDTTVFGYGLIDTENRGAQTIAYLTGTNTDIAGLGIMALDVTDPRNPVYLGTFLKSDILGTNVLEARDGLVYFSIENNYQGGLNLVDFSDPTHPDQVAIAQDPDYSVIQDASMGDQFLYTTNSYGPITVFSMTGDLSGRVTDHNYNPLAGITLTLSTGAETLTGADGAYLFPNLDFGGYVVTPTLGTYTFTPSHREVNIPSDWVSQDFVILPAPVSTTLEPGVATSLTYTDVQGLPTSFIFPADLISTTATAHVTPTLAAGFFGHKFAGHAFELSIDTGLLSKPDEQFSLPVSVTIQYSLEDTAGITDTTRLALYRSDGSTWTEASTSCAPTSSPLTQNPGVFEGVICQEGLYALFGLTYGIALPIVSFGSVSQTCAPPDCIPLPPLSDQE